MKLNHVKIARVAVGFVAAAAVAAVDSAAATDVAAAVVVAAVDSAAATGVAVEASGKSGLSPLPTLGSINKTFSELRKRFFLFLLPSGNTQKRVGKTTEHRECTERRNGKIWQCFNVEPA